MKKAPGNKKIRGVNKVFNVFANITKHPEFIDDIKKLRLKFKIPEDGFSEYDIKELLIANELLYTPKEWFYYGNKRKFKEVNLQMGQFSHQIPELNFGKTIFRFFLFHNVVPEEVFDYFLETANVCKISYSKREFEEQDTGTRSVFEQITEKEVSIYPIAIRIAPDASQNDVVDFIKKNWLDLEYHKKKYRNKNSRIGKVRTSGALERDRFISQNREKSQKELLSIIREKGFKMDESHLRNIKARTKK